MKQVGRVLVVGLLLTAWGCSGKPPEAQVAAGKDLPTPETLSRRLVAACKGLKGWSTRVRMTLHRNGAVMEVVGNGIHQLARQEDNQLIVRSRMSGRSTVETSGGDIIRMSREIVNTGTVIWDETVVADVGQPAVTKRAAGGTDDMGLPAGQNPITEFATYREMFDLAVVDAETLNGEAVWTLAGTFREDYLAGHPDARKLRGLMTKVRLSYGKEDLLPRRMVAHDAAGTETVRIEFTDVKLNPEISEGLFKYTPPPRTRVRDKTGG